MAKTEIYKLKLEADQFLDVAVKIQKNIDDLVTKQKILEVTGKKGSKQWIANATALKENKKALLETKNAIISLNSPYKKLSNQLIRTKKEAKDLAVEFGRNSTQAKNAAREVRKLDKELKKIDSSVGDNQRKVGGYSQAVKGISARFLGWTAAIAGAIAVLKDIFRRIRAFDKSMVGLSAILGESRANIKGLEDAIKEVAGASIKTSNEVADLATALATLGKSKDEIITLLKPVNDLSIALGATSEEAGQLLVKTLNAFGASSTAANRYADIIAKMRTSTALDFEQIKDSLGFLAPVAKVAGLSFEETGAILGVLVDNGIKAARAGRITSTSFLQLAKKGKTLKDALDEINEAQARGVKETELLGLATDLFGAQGGALGIILADNRDRTAELTTELKNAGGELDKLTNAQLKSIDAKLKLVDSAWEKLIIDLDNGNNFLGTIFKLALDNMADSLGKLGFFLRADITAFDRFKIAANQMTQGFSFLIPWVENGTGAFEDSVNKLMSDTAAREKNTKAIIAQREEFVKLNKSLAPLTEGTTQKDTSLPFGIDLLGGNEEQKKERFKQDLEDLEASEKEKEALLKKWQEQHLKDLETYLNNKAKIEDELELKAASGRFERQKIKIEQQAKNDIDDLNRLKISGEKKLEQIKLIEDKKKIDLEGLEEDRINAFENKKRDLENRIEEENAATQEEKEAIKIEQEFEKNIAELERLELTEIEKTELLLLLTQDRELQLKNIRDQYSQDKLKNIEQVNKKEIDAEKRQTQEKARMASQISGILTGLLGNSLGAKLAGIVISGAVEAGLVGMTTASAQARNVAQATAALPPPFNAPLIAAALAQNTIMGAQSAASITKILASSAISGIGSLAGGKFERGALLEGASHDRGGIPFTIGGRPGYEAEGGEAIINKRSMSNPVLRSLASEINVAGGGIPFANGGMLGGSINKVINNGFSADQLNEFIDGKIANIKVQNVAVETIDVADDIIRAENIANL